MVRPTKSGAMVLLRAQVLMMVRSSLLKAATFLASLKSMYGTFLSDRLMLLPLGLVAGSYNKLGGVFALAGLVAKGLLAPRGLRRGTVVLAAADTVTAAVSTAMRVIDSVHDDAADGWSDAL